VVDCHCGESEERIERVVVERDHREGPHCYPRIPRF
jgi:hypothetical protein